MDAGYSLLAHNVRDHHTANMAVHALLHELDVHYERHYPVGLSITSTSRSKLTNVAC